MTDLLRRYYKKVLAGILLLNIIAHLPYLHLPPCSIHVRRQCNTLAVARNFFEEDNNILKPRVDRRYDSDGVTGMQFPAFEWGLAQVYQITGEHYFIQRGYSLLISTLTLVFTFLFFFRYRGDPFLGLAAAWFICWSPEWFYQGLNALPDILAFCCGMGALAFYAGWSLRKTSPQFVTAVLLITLAGLVKIQYGLFGFIIVALLLQQYRKKLISNKHLLHWFLAGTAALVIVIGWYSYAHHLIQQSGLFDFVLNIRPVTDFQTAASIFKKNIISDFPELLFGYAGTLLLLTGLISYRRKDNRKKWIALPAFLLFIVWYVLMLEQMQVHQYYLLPVLALAIFPVLNGIKWITDTRKTSVLYFILLLMPATAMIRILPARWMKEDLGIPAGFANSANLEQLINAVPSEEKVITVPDESGCIWLYFLHKKGFSYEDTSLFTTTNENGEIIFEEYRRRGAKWLYILKGKIENPQDPPNGLMMHQSIGDIDIYRIK